MPDGCQAGRPLTGSLHGRVTLLQNPAGKHKRPCPKKAMTDKLVRQEKIPFFNVFANHSDNSAPRSDS